MSFILSTLFKELIVSFFEVMGIGVLMSVYDKVKVEELHVSIQSILNQTCVDFQLFIGVDGPINEELDGTLNQHCIDSRVRVVRFAENRGLAAVLNDLIEISGHCEYLARMDADDIALPQRLERQVVFLENHPEVDVLGCAVEEFDEKQNSLGVSYYPASSEECYKWFAKWNPVVHSTVMFRHRFFEKAGLYNVNYLRHQDTMLWVSGFKAGCNFANIPEVLMRISTPHDLFKHRLGGWKLAWRSFKDRIWINRQLKYGVEAYWYAFMMFVAMIRPVWFKEMTIKGR